MSEPVRDWLDTAATLIPGYSGYQQKERRRQTDKLYRESLAERLRIAKATLADAMRELTANGGLEMLGSIDRILRKLDHSENQIRFATYGYAGFFDIITVGEAQLDELYRFDLSLSERVGKIENTARALKHAVADREERVALVRDTEAALDELAAAWNRRTDIIKQLSPQGEGQQ